METDKEYAPLILQGALCAAPSIVLAMLAEFGYSIVGPFDIEVRTPLTILVLCLLPFATFHFSRACARIGVIRPDASPLALCLLIGVAMALAQWSRPYLEERFPSGQASRGRSGGGPTVAIQLGIVLAGSLAALAFFPRTTKP